MFLISLPSCSSFSFLFLLINTSLACKYKFIHNASELIEFSNNVNNGTNYENYTVLLADDIIFNEESSKRFKPIGNEGTPNNFIGIFDGQGYTISELTLNTSSTNFIGLFGYSGGTTIKNVVIKDTCSFSSSYLTSSSSTLGFVAGIIGHCKSNNGPCIFENIVNMANISFYGKINYLYLGGINGAITIPDDNYEGRLVNCVNYGSLYNSGSCPNNLFIGGISSEIYAPTGNDKNYIYNSLNYGTIKNEGYSGKYLIGGIIGRAYGSTIENCVSAGTLINTRGNDIGGIIGDANTYDVTITHCYWTSDTGCTKYYSITSSIIDLGIYQISINYTNANNINTYAVANNWSGWTFNRNTKKINFVMHDKEHFSYSSQFVLLPEPARRGYSFLFWCVNENLTDGCKKKYNISETVFTEETALYAQWTVNNCTVTLEVNGGDDLIDNKKIFVNVFNAVYGKSLITPIRRGYTFAGWFTAHGELVTSESLVNNACNCSLYAHWVPNKYNVTFEVNGGNKLGNDMITVTFDEEYSSLPYPVRDGFDFTGWFTNDNKNITNETTVNITSNQILYAQWSPKNYTMTLDVNGGVELVGYEEGVEVISDRAYESLPSPNRSGYTFVGWLTNDNRLITNDTTTTAIVTKDQTLRACWVPNNYTVTLDVNGGDELDSNTLTVTFNTMYGFLPSPTRPGYTFTGWLTKEDEEITNRTIVNITNDSALRANWTANTYNITFNVNGGDELIGTAVTFGSNYSSLPVPSREGYTFLWWYIEDTNEKVYNETNVKTACNHTLCAAWDKNTIIFDVNGGNELDITEKEKEVIYKEKYGYLLVPNRTGYTFDGWLTEGNEKVTNETTVNITSNQTLRACWIPNNYTLSLDVNGGDKPYNNTIIVTFNTTYGHILTPTKIGYTFNGWFNENNQIITSETKVIIVRNQTLRAYWVPNNYTVTFEVNEGDALNDNKRNITVTYNGTYGSLPTPTRYGYTFDGWFNENNEAITSETKVMVPDNQTLHAHWTMVATPTKCVEIVFEKKDMSDKEIINIVKKFTEAKFTITRVEDNETGEIKIIIKFTDVEKAEEFVRSVNDSSNRAKYFIRSVNFNSGFEASHSAMFYQFLLLFTILLI